AWTEKDSIAFSEARCSQIMQVVFAEADTASLILRMARGTGFARETLARLDELVVGVIEADVRAAIDRGVLRPFAPPVVAQFIVGGIEKIVVGALDKGHAPDFAHVAARSPCSCPAASFRATALLRSPSRARPRTRRPTRPGWAEHRRRSFPSGSCRGGVGRARGAHREACRAGCGAPSSPPCVR